MAIPDPDATVPAWSLDIYTDAAGDSPNGSAGALVVGWWTYILWGEAINLGNLASNGDSWIEGFFLSSSSCHF